MKELKYTYVDFVAIKKLDVSISEYILCDIIYKLQAKQGFCWASNDYFSKCLNITDRAVINMIKRLIEKDIIVVIEKVKGKTNKLCVADIWHETVIFSSEQTSPSGEQSSVEPVNKVHTTYEQTSHNSNIYNNSDNNNNNISNITLTKVAASPKRAVKVKKELILQNSHSDIFSMLKYFYEKMLPAVDPVFSPSNRVSLDKLLSTYGTQGVRATIDKAKLILSEPYGGRAKVTSIAGFAANYELIKGYQLSVKTVLQPVTRI